MQNYVPCVFKNRRGQGFETKRNRTWKLDVQCNSYGSLEGLRKLKDLESTPKRSHLKPNGHKLSILSRTNLKDSVQDQM